MSDSRSDLPTPTGWRQQQTSLKVFELSPDHPDYPEPWRNDAQERAWDQLSKSSDVTKMARAIESRWAESGVIEEIRLITLPAERRARIVGDQTLLGELQELMIMITTVFQQASYRLQPSLGIAHELIVDYLARATLPADIAPFFAPKVSPGTVIANAEETLAVMVVLHPGEFVVKGHGVGRKDIAMNIGKFITEVQKLIDDHQGRAARKPGPKPNIELALAVKALKDRGMRAVEVCDTLELGYRDANEARRIVREWAKKAERYTEGSTAIGSPTVSPSDS